MTSSGTTDFAHGAPGDGSSLSQQGQPHELGANQRGMTPTDDGAGGEMHRANSSMSQSHTLTPSRGGTLKKKQSLKRSGSKRTGSRRNSFAGSIKGLAVGDQQYDGADDEQMNTWRKILKDLITYFRDIQKSYETRSKSMYAISNVINNTNVPSGFLTDGGIGDATHILRDYHKHAISEGNKAKAVEEDVVIQLTGLRSDLQQKIKEIKSLSGDFKNNVDRETEGTRRAVRDLQEALGVAEADPNTPHGKGDPYIVKLGVDRQLERQIEEENYLHRAFLNLESSGRELESIVVGEIQKAYNAFAGILKREADEAYETVDRLRAGPVAMAKDHEWDAFVENNEHFVDPRLPVRRFQNINYPGRDNPAASEVKAGMLERKSKYVKSYTPGWYVLTPTHIHEFKSPDRITSQTPIMSLNLAEQKLGTHSNADSSSHKFMLKGRQAGGLHRGHTWVFRAESCDTMLAWYEDLRNLTEKTGEERKAFIRRHARSMSTGSQKAGSISSEGMEEDEADQVPYSATASQVDTSQQQEKLPERPNPGGRFPSALNINRDSHVALSPSSPSSSGDRDAAIAAAGALPGSGVPFGASGQAVKTGGDETKGGELGGFQEPAAQANAYIPSPDQKRHAQYIPSGAGDPVSPISPEAEYYGNISPQQPRTAPIPRAFPQQVERHDSKYGDWMSPAAGGALAGAGVVGAYKHHEQQKKDKLQEPDDGLVPAEPAVVASSSKELGQSTTESAVAPAKIAPSEPPANESQPSNIVPPAGSEPSPMPIPAPIAIPSANHQAQTTPQQPDFVPISQQAEYNGLSVNAGPSPTSVFSSGGPGSNDPAAPVKALANDPDFVAPKRPALESHPSVATISDLHVPGEYPPTPAIGRRPS